MSYGYLHKFSGSRGNVMDVESVESGSSIDIDHFDDCKFVVLSSVSHPELSNSLIRSMHVTPDFLSIHFCFRAAT